MSIFTEHGINIVAIVDRIKTEAEDMEQMATLIDGEVLAYCNLYDARKPFAVNMYDKAIPLGDNSIVGEIYATEEDFDDDYCGRLVVKNAMKDGILRTWYEEIWNLET